MNNDVANMLNNFPLISIIVPIFNVSDYIDECLRSVITQTYSNIEILCIDDCGTDNSMEIVNRYARTDTRIKILKHTVNKGLAPARNLGIVEAKGDFIFFLDSDDYIHTTTIQELVKNAITTQADIILCNSKTFLDKKYTTSALNKHINKLNTLLTADFDTLKVTDENFYSCLSRVPCVAWGKLFKTQFIKKHNLKFINKKVLHEDNGFQAKFLACKPLISCVHNELYFYRIRPNSITQNTISKANKARNLDLSIQDAISFILNSKNPSLVSELHDFYYSLFTHRNLCMNFYWGKRSKLLKILCIPIINYHSNGENTIKLKIFGIRFV